MDHQDWRKKQDKRQVMDTLTAMLTDGEYKIYNHLKFKDKVTIVRIYR